MTDFEEDIAGLPAPVPNQPLRIGWDLVHSVEASRLRRHGVSVLLRQGAARGTFLSRRRQPGLHGDHLYEQ